MAETASARTEGTCPLEVNLIFLLSAVPSVVLIPGFLSV